MATLGPSQETNTQKKKDKSKPKKDRTGDKPSFLSEEFVVDSDSDAPIGNSKPGHATPKSVVKSTGTISKPPQTARVSRAIPKQTIPSKRNDPDQKSGATVKAKNLAQQIKGTKQTESAPKSLVKTKPIISSQRHPLPLREEVATPAPKAHPITNGTTKAEPTTNDSAKSEVVASGVTKSLPLAVRNKESEAKSSSEEDTDGDENEDTEEDGDDDEEVKAKDNAIKPGSSRTLFAHLAVLKKGAVSVPRHTSLETTRPTTKKVPAATEKQASSAVAQAPESGESSSEAEDEDEGSEVQKKSAGKLPAQLAALKKDLSPLNPRTPSEKPEHIIKKPSQSSEKNASLANENDSEDKESVSEEEEDLDDDHGESSNSSESDTRNTRKTAVPKTPTATRPTPTPMQVYNPPPGFSLATSSLPSSSQLLNIFSQSNLASKQIWHIALPASVPVSALKEISMDTILKGTAAFSYKDTDYAFMAVTKAKEPIAHVLVPGDQGTEYMAAPSGIKRSLHVQQVLRLPDLARTSQDVQVHKEAGNGNTNVSTTGKVGETVLPPRHSAVHELPKGLKMRFKPVGVTDSGPETIWTDSEEEREKQAEHMRNVAFHMPPGYEAVQSKFKKKIDETNGIEGGSQQSPTKKRKKLGKEREVGLSSQRVIASTQETGASNLSQLKDTEALSQEPPAKKSKKHRQEREGESAIGNVLAVTQDTVKNHSPRTNGVERGSQESSAKKRKKHREEREEAPTDTEIPPSNQEMARRLSVQSNGVERGSKESPIQTQKKHEKRQVEESVRAEVPPSTQDTAGKESSQANGTKNGVQGGSQELPTMKQEKRGTRQEDKSVHVKLLSSTQENIEKHKSQAHSKNNGVQGVIQDTKKRNKHRKETDGEPGREQPAPDTHETDRNTATEVSGREKHAEEGLITKDTPGNNDRETAEDKAQRHAEKSRLKRERRQKGAEARASSQLASTQ